MDEQRVAIRSIRASPMCGWRGPTSSMRSTSRCSTRSSPRSPSWARRRGCARWWSRAKGAASARGSTWRAWRAPDRGSISPRRTHGIANDYQQVAWGCGTLGVPVIAALHGGRVRRRVADRERRRRSVRRAGHADVGDGDQMGHRPRHGGVRAVARVRARRCAARARLYPRASSAPRRGASMASSRRSPRIRMRGDGAGAGDRGAQPGGCARRQAARQPRGPCERRRDPPRRECRAGGAAAHAQPDRGRDGQYAETRAAVRRPADFHPAPNEPATRKFNKV